MTNLTMLVHNRPRLTKQALESLDCTAGSGVFVSILDDASDDLEMAKVLDGRCVTRNEESRGTGAARNQIIKWTDANVGRGDYLYLSDNDVYFHKDWHGTLIDAYEAAWKQGFRVLGAYNHPFHIPIAKVSVGNGWEVHEVLALALQSMLMRWEVWDKYGPFRETAPGRVCDGEDVDFGNAIRADGFRLGVISPALVVNCGVTNSFGQPIPGADLVRTQAPQGVIVE